MTEAERVGQLLMVDCPSTYVADATVAALQAQHAGSVILDHNSYLSVGSMAGLTAQLENDNPSPAKLLIATDQEGGLVQRLRGDGFSSIPSAVDQGQMAPAALRGQADEWGNELRSAGVRLDLSPVLDTVPAGWGSNPPIGDLNREFGSTPSTVTAHGVAVVDGLRQAGVAAAVKHFPSLGRTSGNTDVSSGVTDTITTRHDAYLAPFAAAVNDGVPFVMISTAIYSNIDPGTPAAFSPVVIDGMLRGDLGFGGVVISDDLGQAGQVLYLSPGQRAIDFVNAGGDMVLTVSPETVPQMAAALLAKANADPAFKAKVDASALRVLRAKQAMGLLGQ